MRDTQPQIKKNIYIIICVKPYPLCMYRRPDVVRQQQHARHSQSYSFHLWRFQVTVTADETLKLSLSTNSPVVGAHGNVAGTARCHTLQVESAVLSQRSY